MIEIKLLTESPETIQNALQRRHQNPSLLVEAVRINSERKNLQQKFDALRSEQNTKSKDIAIWKKEGRDTTSLMAELKSLSEQAKTAGAAQAEKEQQLEALALQIPNLPHVSVPDGHDETANIEIHRRGTPKKFSFKPLEHFEIGEALGLLDFDRAAKIAGARFAILRGDLARLERSLIQFMLDVHTREHGYEEFLPPLMVNAKTATGTGQLPKFEEDLFKTTSGYYLIPTAEVPLTNIYREEILEEADLPQYLTAYTPCFRSEAGSHGKDVKGLIRQHQFNKVELVKITHPEKSYDELEGMRKNAEKILELLEIPFRTVQLCTGDMGFSAAKTYDIEVWLPGQDRYREISSCSNCEAFQARRMNLRFRRGKILDFPHTLNGSGLAVGRTLIAILENYQQEDGSVVIPKILQNYFGKEKIGP